MLEMMHKLRLELRLELMLMKFLILKLKQCFKLRLE
jgi:hypothetical protein